MSKATKIEIKPARDLARTKACQLIAQKYQRTMDWAYKISRRDSTVKEGPYYELALKDYESAYKQYQQIINSVK